MLYYKYTEPSTKIQTSDQRADHRVQKNNFPGIHSNVHWCIYILLHPGRVNLDLPLDVPFVWEINQGYIPVDSFDLMCESVTFGYIYLYA